MSNSSVDTYAGTPGKTQTDIHHPNGEVPFTGLDVVLVGGGGLLMLAAGVLAALAARRRA